MRKNKEVAQPHWEWLIPNTPRQEAGRLGSLWKATRLSPDPASGETAERTRYRQRNWQDIWPTLTWCIITGGMPAVFVLVARLAKADPRLVPLAIAVGIASVSWFYAAWPSRFFDDDSLITVIETIEKATGRDLDGNGIVGRQPNEVTLKGELPITPKKTLYTAFKVKKPWAFHRFCQDVAASRCKFSKTASKRYKLASDWPGIQSEWERRGLLVPQGERKAPKLTPAGKRMVRLFAKNAPSSPADPRD